MKPIRNKKAYHNYEILETLEAGIVLNGDEVKSIRTGQANLRDAYARIENGELWLWNASIPKYKFSSREDYKPRRNRKLLVKKFQIERLIGKIQSGKLTLVPLKLYDKNGRIKVEIGLARGKKQYEKRRKQKERTLDRELHRAKRKFGGRKP